MLVADSAANVCPTLQPLLHGPPLQRLFAWDQHVPTFRSWDNVFRYSFPVIAGSTITSSINTRAVHSSRGPCQRPRRRPTLPPHPRLHVVPTKQNYKILGIGVRLRYREGFRAAMGLQVVHPKDRAEALQRNCLWHSQRRTASLGSPQDSRPVWKKFCTSVLKPSKGYQSIDSKGFQPRFGRTPRPSNSKSLYQELR